jgi:hypothetical protein
MKNLFLLFVLISFASCKEEKIKKIEIGKNVKCEPIEYKVQEPGIAMLKDSKTKAKFVKKSEQTK